MESPPNSIKNRITANGTITYAGGPSPSAPRRRAPILACNICGLRNGETCSVSGKPIVEHYLADPPNCPDPAGSHFAEISIAGHPIKKSSQRQSLPARTFDPVPFEQWPSRLGGIRGMLLMGIKDLVEYAAYPDKGIGDTITRNLGIKGELFKATLKSVGIDCGCNAKAVEYNQKYPYDGIDGRPTLRQGG